MPGKIPIIYSDEYYVDIGDHVFPTSKYRILRKRVFSDPYLADKCAIISPEKITEEVVKLTHEASYIDRLLGGVISPEEALALELPFSPEMVRSSFTCCGGTLTASRQAISSNVAVHLGGGFHHAFAGHGEGFCMLNDIAVSINALIAEKAVKKALVLDCDLHQGNGTASIFADNDDVFTFSIHQQNNYPFHKPESDLDIGLGDYTGDREYLAHLYDNIPKVISLFKPDIILYLAGADPYKDDQLGKLSITKDGLRKRDNFVCSQARNFSVPLAITLAGGYAYKRDDTVDIHMATVEECVKVFG
jgi:acetoin utilization deacetylase AcuC-like enzyme